MMKRAPKVQDFIDKIAEQAGMRVEEGQCCICRRKILSISFRDLLSYQEYEISGMCQWCQDDFYLDLEEN
jgi:hypothetical protein